MSVTILHGDCRAILPTLPGGLFDCCVTSPPYWGLRDYGVKGQIGLEPTMQGYLETMVGVCREVRRVLKPTATMWLNVGDSYAGYHGNKNAEIPTSATNGWTRGTNENKRTSTANRNGLKAKDLCLVPNRLAQMLQEPWYAGSLKSPRDRAWLAALVDGEGSIFIARQREGTPTGRNRASFRSQDSFQPGLVIANTNKALLERAAEITGFGNIQMAKRGPSNRRDSYVWRISGSKASSVLREIYPDLIAKQKEARIALACGPSGEHAAQCYESLKGLHQGETFDFDAPAPTSLYERGWYVRSEIIWAKPNPMPESVKDRPTSAHEKVWLLTKSERYFYDADAIAEPFVMQEGGRTIERGAHGSSKARGAGGQADQSNIGGFTRTKDARNARNVWPIASLPYSGAHFATMPPALAERCIKAGCPEGGTVLDPFGGAGTTGLVADRLGRHATLIELNPGYRDLAADRVQSDAPLFAEVTA